jgi:S-adenosylmethionine synthetase
MKAYVYKWGDELCISRYEEDDSIEIEIDKECFDKYVKAWDDYQDMQAELHKAIS